MYIFLKHLNIFDDLVNDHIMSFLPFYYIINNIKNLDYIWYKRLIVFNIGDIKRMDMNYKNWYRIFYYKDHFILINYEYKLIKYLKLTKSIKEINDIHLMNIQNCHKKHFMNYTYF